LHVPHTQNAHAMKATTTTRTTHYQTTGGAKTLRLQTHSRKKNAFQMLHGNDRRRSEMLKPKL